MAVPIDPAVQALADIDEAIENYWLAVEVGDAGLRRTAIHLAWDELAGVVVVGLDAGVTVGQMAGRSAVISAAVRHVSRRRWVR
jgi:hypothetical protein